MPSAPGAAGRGRRWRGNHCACRWCWPAPIGYKYSRDSLNKPILIPTEESRLIKRAFELFGSGHYRQTDVSDMLRSEGLKQATKTQLNKILRNCLYAGLVKNDWLDEYVEGLHEPIVSKETYFSVQAMLDGKQYGLPEGIHPGGCALYFNVNLFEQTGVKPPTLDWTVDDFVNAARQLTRHLPQRLHVSRSGREPWFLDAP